MAVRNAGPATRAIVPGTTKISMGKVSSTGRRSAFAAIRNARCVRSPAAMFFIDWVSGVPKRSL